LKLQKIPVGNEQKLFFIHRKGARLMQEMWKNKLPKLYEIFSESNPNNPNNCFIGMDKQLKVGDALQKYHKLETSLCQLDPAAWQGFKQKVVGCVCAKHDLHGWRQLIDCFNETKGYIYLREKEFHDIQFIDTGVGSTPDLRASSEEGVVLLEVKTINKSDIACRAMKSAVLQQVQTNLSKEFDYKLGCVIAKARDQLYAYQDKNISRRIAYLIIYPDLVNALASGSEEEVGRLIEKKRQSNPDIDIEANYQPFVPLFGN
jgi:hypothetical protein